MADASAADVSSSIKHCGAALKELSGYRILVGLLTARHFGLPRAVSIVEHGTDAASEGRDAVLQALHNEAERTLVTKTEELANSPHLRFFHWDIEFPEVFSA